MTVQLGARPPYRRHGTWCMSRQGSPPKRRGAGGAGRGKRSHIATGLRAVAVLAMLCLLCSCVHDSRLSVESHASTVTPSGCDLPIAQHGVQPLPPEAPTPLHKAVEGGDVEAARRLIGDGVRVDARDDWGRTALHIAAKHGNVSMAELLLANGADPNAQTPEGWRLLPPPVAGGAPSVDELVLQRPSLIAEGRLVPFPYRDRGPLHLAADGGHSAVVSLLLSHGADVDLRDDTGRTALHHAALSADVRTLEVLASAGAEVGARDDDGATALHAAACSGNAQTAAALASLGTPLDTRAILESTAFRGIGHAMLRSRVSGDPESEEQARRFHALTAGASRASADPCCWTALHAAAMNGRAEVCRVLTRHGADVEARGCLGWTALHLAALMGSAETVSALLSEGASREAEDDWGRTPSDLAAKLGHAAVVSLLDTWGKGK